MRINKKIILPVLIFSLFATIAYAKSFTDVLGESFSLINDFFKNEGYKPYSLIIDFFVFFVVFLAIYMRGIKFAFKEVTKTEKALAVILGLATAFLMVIGGYSISKLLPFVNLLLYFLLFALMWWLLKDMKSKWARFFLALLLTLLLLLLFLALFSATSYKISCPGSALTWLPWLLALLLFILFWFLLKDIKNAFGRFLLALLLTIAIVLLILFLLKTFSKDLGCPEGPFATNLFDDIEDSFKRMDIGTGFGGFGLSLPSLPELTKVDAPDKKSGEGLTTGPEAQRPFKIYKDEELQQFLKDPRTQFPSIKPKIEEEIRIRNEEKQQKIRQEREKSAESAGLLLGVPRKEGMTLEQHEQEILKQSENRKHVGSGKFYPEKKDDKVIIKEDKWLWPDSVVDPNKDPNVKTYIENERKKQQQAPTPVPSQPTPEGKTLAPTAPPTGQEPPLKPVPPPTGISPTSSLQDNESNKGLVYAADGGLTVLLYFLWKYWGKRRFKEWREKKKWGFGSRDKLEKTIPEILAKIELIKKDKNDYMANLDKLKGYRDLAKKAEDIRAVFIARLKDRNEQAYLFDDPKEILGEMEKGIDLLSQTEQKLIHSTRAFGENEVSLLRRLEPWQEILRKDNINADIEFKDLNRIIGTDPKSILNTILDLFEISAQGANYEKALKKLFRNRVILVTKRINRFLKDEHRLSELLEEDSQKIKHLLELVRLQKDLIESLKRKIEAGPVEGGGGIIDAKTFSEDRIIKLQIKNLSAYLDSLEFSIFSSSAPAQILRNQREAIGELKNDLNAVVQIFRNQAQAFEIARVHSWFAPIPVDNIGGLRQGTVNPLEFVNLAIETISREANQVEDSLRKMRIEIRERDSEAGPKRPGFSRAKKSLLFTASGAVVTAAVAGGALYLSQPSPPQPPERAPIVRQKEARSLEILSKPRPTDTKYIIVQYYITDTKNQNAIYNVTGYLSPPGTAQYLQLETYRVRANTPFETVFAARRTQEGKPIPDGTYNLILTALTLDENGKDVVIKSQFVKVTLGKQ